MTIGVDIRILGQPRRTGIVEYTEQLLSRMITAAPEHRFKLFYASWRRTLPNYEWLHAPNVELHSFRVPNSLLFLANRLFDWPNIDRLIGGADAFFLPHLFITSLSRQCRRVMTFHDLSYLRFPEFFTLGQRLWHSLLMNPAWQVRWSDRVIAVSESTKADLIRFYHLDPANVQVIYSGANLKRLSADRLQEFQDKKQLPDRFILSMSTLSPRKNIVAIIRAFTELKERPGFDDIRLIIGGDRGWLDRSIFNEIQRSSAQRYIRYIGYVPDDQRAAWYSAASVFVYPSFFEGFGLPVLEAMTCGTPVITSHNSSLPEVAADGALLVDPYNPADIVDALQAVLNDHNFRKKLIENGIIRGKQFTWEHCAQETLKVICPL